VHQPCARLVKRAGYPCTYDVRCSNFRRKALTLAKRQVEVTSCFNVMLRGREHRRRTGQPLVPVFLCLCCPFRAVSAGEGIALGVTFLPLDCAKGNYRTWCCPCQNCVHETMRWYERLMQTNNYRSGVKEKGKEGYLKQARASHDCTT
jgi:hypothetical protein